MNNGRYPKNNRKRRLRWSKQFVLLAAIVVLLTGVIGGSLAYLFTSTDEVVNTFTPASNDPTIPEDFDGSTKSNVKVSVTGDSVLTSYVRAKIVYSWVSADGTQVAPQAASAADCATLEINSTDWQLVDGYYYYKGTVAGGAETSNLINTCTPVKNSITIDDVTYYFCVDIFAQTIQSYPEEAVIDSWGMTYSNATWSTYAG